MEMQYVQNVIKSIKIDEQWKYVLYWANAQGIWNL